MTLDKICMRIKRVGMEVLSILVFFSSPTNSSRMSDLKPATLRHGEREANSGSNGRETSSFLLLPVFWLFFFLQMDSDEKTPSDDADRWTRARLFYRTARATTHALSLFISNTRLPCGLLCLHTHITMVPYRAQLLGSRYGIFFQLKKFLLGFIFEWKCKTYKQKKAAYLQGSARNRLGYFLHLFLNRLEADKHKIKQSKLQWC